MTAPDLKPCPFCGGEADIERLGDRRQSTIYACLMCGCRLETGEEWNHGADWNRRDPAVLARDETVQAMIGAVVEEAANKLLDLVAERKAAKKNAGNDYIAACARKVSALRPDASAALARAMQQARNDALEEAAMVAESIDGWMGLPHQSNMDYGPNTSRKIAAAIRALKETKA